MIINASNPAYTHRVNRNQRAVFALADGMPVFEVWIWHARTKLWFVMSYEDPPTLRDSGIIFFSPEHGSLPPQAVA